MDRRVHRTSEQRGTVFASGHSGRGDVRSRNVRRDSERGYAHPMRRPRVLFAAAVVAGAILLLLFALSRSAPLPAFQEVRIPYSAADAVVFDRHHDGTYQIGV